jgi:hypothetical protein
LFNVAIEKPILVLPPAALAAGALAAALAGALADDPLLLDDDEDELSLFEHPLNAAAAHSSTAPVDFPNIPQLSNLAELQAMAVSVVRVVQYDFVAVRLRLRDARFSDPPCCACRKS